MPNTKTPLEIWTPIARTLPGTDFTLDLPAHVLSGEAVDVAKFAAKYWTARRDPETGAILFPGLELAGRKDTLNPTLIADILSGREAFNEAHTQYLLVTTPTSDPSPLPRARHVLREIVTALEWLFDDGVEDERDAKLAKVTAAHAGDPETLDAVALQLRSYGALAREYRKDLESLGTFQVGLLDEAGQLAEALTSRPAAGKERNAKEVEALELRNRIGTVLMQKIRLVRGAARYVFRHHPEVVREASSTYERRKRAEARRKQKDKSES
jgi:hypothetical protein